MQIEKFDDIKIAGKYCVIKDHITFYPAFYLYFQKGSYKEVNKNYNV